MEEEKDSDICPRTKKLFSKIKQECEECEFREKCPLLILSRRVKVEDRIGNVVCPKTENLVSISKCLECEDNKTCSALNL